MAEIKYQIKGTANTGPISAMARSVELLSSSASGAQDTMMGLEAAAQGNVTAMFSMAKSVKALWTAIQAGQMAVPLLAALSAAVWALSKAWQWYKQKQEDANTAMEEAARATDNFRRQLNALRQVQQEITWDAQIKSLDTLTKSYDRAAAAADSLAKVQDEQRTYTAAAGRAEIEARGAREMREAAPEDRDTIRANMERELAAYDYQQRYSDLQTQSARLAEQRAALGPKGAESKLSQLAYRRMMAADGRPVQDSAQNVAALEAQLKGMRGKSDTDAGKAKYLEISKQLQTARAHHDKLLAQQAEMVKNLDEQIAATKQDIALLDQKETVIKNALAALDAEYQAKSELMSLEQRRAAEQQAAARAEALRAAREKAASAEKQAALEREKELADAAAKARAADANRLAGLQKIAGQAQADYEEKYALATDPAARAAKRKADREAAREQSNWERQVGRAELARERQGGDISKLTPHQRRILEAEEERKLAKGAADAAQALEKKMAEDIGQSRATLEDIRADLQKSLNMT